MNTSTSLRGLALISTLLLCQANQLRGENLPKLYQHFTRDGIKSGLVANNSTFTLNGKGIKILSGAIHYFRVHPRYWRDRLRKLRAAGFNAVETYAPWNLHEPRKNHFDFGDKNQDFSTFLDVRRFLKIAQEEDLLVIFRPGPFISAEWDFGGLPSWLLRDEKLQVRRYNRPFLKPVEKYFNKLLPLLADFKFTAGGPIVAIQIENEYGSFQPRDKRYLEWLTDLVESLGFGDTLLLTSDPPFNGLNGTLPGKLLHTVNFGLDPEGAFDKLEKMQTSKPRFVMEYYPGFLEFWMAEKHLTMNVTEFIRGLDTILGPKYNGNVNVYMFHGGTNFGLMSGAVPSSTDPSGLSFQLTSYDYLAPLSEAGDPTPLYYKIIDVVDRYQTPRLHRPKIPKLIPKKAYGQLKPIDFMSYETIVQQVPDDSRFFVRKPASMEDLPMNDKNGQSYGYIVHRSKLYVENGSEFEAGVVKDFGLLLIDGAIQSGSYDGCSTNTSCYWINRAKKFRLDGFQSGEHTVDLFVENMGRRNFGGVEEMKQKKGLPDGFISLNGRHLEDFEVFALEFKSDWVKNLTGFEPIVESFRGKPGPIIARFQLEIMDEPMDTFVSMRGWHKGIVLINGFNLGRYWKVGPQKNLYLPAPLLNKGLNTILVFEEIAAGGSIRLEECPDFGDRNTSETNSCVQNSMSYM